MTDIQAMLKEWADAIETPCPETPTVAGFETEQLRLDLLREEYQEYLDATELEDLVEIADALGDMVYIIYGTARAYGIDLNAVLTEIHRSNMAKVGPDGSVRRRADGKILKPEGWQPPNIARVLGLAE